MHIYTEEVKAAVSMPELLARYGLYSGTGNRIRCPLHCGSNPYSFAFKDKSFICFSCGASGDVISFTQQYFQLNFKDAIKKLNDDFALGLPIDRPLTLREQQSIIDKGKVREAEAARKRAENDALHREWERCLDEFARLDRQRTDYAPALMSDKPHPLFIEALHKIEHAAYNLDEAERRLIEHGTH